jgi:biotin synthase
MEGRPQLPAEDVLRTIAFFRFINPTANIRLAAGRKVLPQNGATAFRAGASASITGNMLTTSGTYHQRRHGDAQGTRAHESG